MSEILPRHYIIGVIMFTLVILSGVAILGEFRSADPNFGDEDKLDQFNRTFNIYDELTEEVDGLESAISSADEELSITDVLGGLILSGWNTLRLLFGSFAILNVVFGGLSSMFGLPTWIGGLIVLLVTVILAFAIYSAIFQREI